MRRADFDEKAMELKINKNLDRGLTLREILSLLLGEALENQNKIILLETRGSELSDQIDYIREKYFPNGGSK